MTDIQVDLPAPVSPKNTIRISTNSWSSSILRRTSTLATFRVGVTAVSRTTDKVTHRSVSSSARTFATVVGILRTVAAGGWIYITSTDHHLVHDISMISYILFSLLLMASTCLITKKLEQVRGVSSYRYR